MESFDGRIHRNDGSLVDGITVDIGIANATSRSLDGNFEVDADNVVTSVPVQSEGDFRGGERLFSLMDIPTNAQLAGWFYNDGGEWTRVEVGTTLPTSATIKGNWRITTLSIDGGDELYVQPGEVFQVPRMTMTHTWSLLNQDGDDADSICGNYYDVGSGSVTYLTGRWGDDIIGSFGYIQPSNLVDVNGGRYTTQYGVDEQVHSPLHEYVGDQYTEYGPTYPLYCDGDVWWGDKWYANHPNANIKVDPLLPDGTVLEFRVFAPMFSDNRGFGPILGTFSVTVGEAPKEESSVTFTPSSLTLVEGADPVTVMIGGVGDGELTGEYEPNGVLEVTAVPGGLSVKPIKAGTCTISVTRGETDKYEAKTATLTVTVTEKQKEPETVAIWRLCNDTTGEHLYTAQRNEHDALVASGAWRSEGESWQAPTEGKAVYRLYNRFLDDHLYTIDTNEVSTLTGRGDWVADNNGQPVFYSGGTVNLYRLYNPSNSRHLITRDANEYNTLPTFGWNQEGVKLYAVI